MNVWIIEFQKDFESICTSWIKENMSKSPQSMSQFLHSHIYLCRRIVPLTKNRNYGEQALGRYLNISHYTFIDNIYFTISFERIIWVIQIHSVYIIDSYMWLVLYVILSRSNKNVTLEWNLTQGWVSKL